MNDLAQLRSVKPETIINYVENLFYSELDAPWWEKFFPEHVTDCSVTVNQATHGDDGLIIIVGLTHACPHARVLITHETYKTYGANYLTDEQAEGLAAEFNSKVERVVTEDVYSHETFVPRLTLAIQSLVANEALNAACPSAKDFIWPHAIRDMFIARNYYLISVQFDVVIEGYVDNPYTANEVKAAYSELVQRHQG
jgi:hypothetical protein